MCDCCNVGGERKGDAGKLRAFGSQGEILKNDMGREVSSKLRIFALCLTKCRTEEA